MYISQNETLDSLEDWMRVIRNLVESTVYNRDDDYRKSILSIKKMLPFSNDILNYIIENEVTGFLNEQVDEEVIKAKLILKNGDWGREIKQIENQGYFKGQINFLLKFSGIKELHEKSEESFSNDLTEDLFESFINYTRKTELLFDGYGLKGLKDNLIERALLTIGDYTLDKGRNSSFLKNDDRDISWRRFLRNDVKNSFLKELLDSISVENFEADLKTLIKEFKNESSWRYHFIKNSELINVCGKNRFFRWSYEGKSILLLENNTTFGYHYEYYSYALCLKLQKIYKADVNYETNKSVDYLKYISKINNKKIDISFDNYSGIFQYLVENKKLRMEFRKQSEVIIYLKEENII